MERSARRSEHGSRERRRSARHGPVTPQTRRVRMGGPRSQRIVGRGRLIRMGGLGDVGGQAEGGAASLGRRHGLEPEAGTETAVDQGDGVELEAVPDAG